MSLKTAPIIKLPDIGKIQDDSTRKALEQLLRFMFDNQRNIYDDLNSSATNFGDSGTDGSWRLVRDGNNLSVQRREAGVWVEKSAFVP